MTTAWSAQAPPSLTSGRRAHPQVPGQSPPGQPRPNGRGNAEIAHARQLWASLPTQFAERFRPAANGMAREIIEAIQEAVPAYSQPLKGPFGAALTQGVEQAIHQCIDSMHGADRPQQQWLALYRHIGKIEFHEGRSLDALQSAYRVGGRVATRYIAEFAKTNKLDDSFFCRAAEAVMTYIDAISMLSLEGYTAAKARSAGAVARRRRRLLELLLDDPPAASQTITALAANAAWPVPESVTLVALEPRRDQHEMTLPTFGDEVLANLEGARPCLLLPGGVAETGELAAALDGWRAVIGIEVPLTNARTSLHWARRTLKLVLRGVIADAPVTRCTDHLTTLWLLTDEFLMKQLSKRCLAPFAGLTTKQRSRLSATLLALLRSSGSAPEIAEMLNVHPQTVRYRLRQLRELFGGRLYDPGDRLELEVALRAETLTDARH